MRFQFLNDGSEFRSYGGGNFSKSNNNSGGLFWWTIFITMLMAMATASWFFSILVFAHPEKPFNYKLLTRLEKLEPLRGYSRETVPYGPFLTANKLFSDYFDYSPEQLTVANDTMKRNYIKNFKDANPSYVKGKFTVLGGRALTSNDVFTEGWAIIARSADLEDVQIECILPGLVADQAPYKAGDEIRLDSLFAPMVHVQRLEGDRVSATVVPIVFEESLKVASGEAYKLQPPGKLNMEAAWPVLHDLHLEDVADATIKQTAIPMVVAGAQ
jgi:hypothetical protein